MRLQISQKAGPNVLVLAGTTEARQTCDLLMRQGIQATASLAGRVKRPQILPVPTRIGGFGGVVGLAQYIRENKITHVVDATHPFAAQISRHAQIASQTTGVALAVLQRPAWQAGPGDNWIRVPDMEGAVAALNGPRQRVFLGIGRQHLSAFASIPQHHYVSRVIDPPETVPDLPCLHLISEKGPFRTQDDIALLKNHRIAIVVSKNSGGTAAQSKIDAANQLKLPVIMIDRPGRDADHGAVTHLTTPDKVIDWLRHSPP